jgi:hypothetical protein
VFPRVDTLSFDQAWSPCSTRHETDDRTEFDSTAQPTVPPNKIAQQSSSSFVLSLIRSPLGHSIDSARSFVSADYPSAGFDAFCPSSPTRNNRRTSPWCSSGEQHIKRRGPHTPICNFFLTDSGLLHDRVRLGKSFPMGACSTSGDQNLLRYDLGPHHCDCHVSTQ